MPGVRNQCKECRNGERFGPHLLGSQGLRRVYATSPALVDIFASVDAARYALESYIASFAELGSGVGKDVLKIGVGMG